MKPIKQAPADVYRLLADTVVDTMYEGIYTWEEVTKAAEDARRYEADYYAGARS